MIRYKTGNLLESEAQALVNTVNTVGVMGKGIALQFKNAFPTNFKEYVAACKNKNIAIGKLLITKENSLLGGEKIIINFPTKTHWRSPSKYEYIESGLVEIKKEIVARNIKSLALPPLGAGNGGLQWNKVQQLLEKHLKDLDCEILIYEPSAAVKEILKKERVKLTPARAMLLSVLYETIKNGEFVSEFGAEKAAYFLQKFGAQDAFKLKFKPYFYGPYSGKVRHMLYHLNGSYVMGYGTKDKKPFDSIDLVMSAEKDIEEYLNRPENIPFKRITEKTKKFLQGFYCFFGLELLSTVDLIISEKNIHSVDEIHKELERWSHRKKTQFSNKKFVQLATENIQKNLIPSLKVKT